MLQKKKVVLIVKIIIKKKIKAKIKKHNIEMKRVLRQIMIKKLELKFQSKYMEILSMKKNKNIQTIDPILMKNLAASIFGKVPVRQEKIIAYFMKRKYFHQILN